MCRFAVRGGAPAPQAHENVKLETPIDLEALFANGDDDLDASDLALLALFSGPTSRDGPAVSSNAGPALDAGANVVMGQALMAPMPTAAPVAVPLAVTAAAPQNPVQQLQFQAVLQHQAAIMQNPTAYPAAAHMYQHAILQQQQQAAAAAAAQQHMLAAVQQPVVVLPGMPMPAAAAPQPALVSLGKRGKSSVEVEEQTERIKKRRRESAQRSRQRKNVYMKSLEMENRALKMENERLRAELTKCAAGGVVTMPLPPALAPRGSSGSVAPRAPSADDCYDDGSEHVSVSDEEDELCDPILMDTMGVGMVGLGGTAADPLALLPTADMLHFNF